MSEYGLAIFDSGYFKVVTTFEKKFFKVIATFCKYVTGSLSPTRVIRNDEVVLLERNNLTVFQKKLIATLFTFSKEKHCSFNFSQK